MCSALHKPRYKCSKVASTCRREKKAVAESGVFMQVYDNCDNRRSDGNGGLCMPHIHVPKDAVWHLRCYAVLVDHTSELLGSSAGKDISLPLEPCFYNYYTFFQAICSAAWLLYDDFCQQGSNVYRFTIIVASNDLIVYKIYALSVCLLSVEVLAVHHPGEGGGAGQTSLPRPQTPGKGSLPIHSFLLWLLSPHNPILVNKEALQAVKPLCSVRLKSPGELDCLNS